MILTLPPHLSQVSISILKTRFNLCAQVIEKVRACKAREAGLGQVRFSAAVWSCAPFGILIFLPLPRFASVTCARYLLLGANTPL